MADGRTRRYRFRHVVAAACLLLAELHPALAQNPAPALPAARAQRFLAARRTSSGRGGVPAASLAKARQQHAHITATSPAASTNLITAWQPVGPNQVASLAYGNVTGRVTSIAIDPADATGNTVYVGTTGGGVWKSVNAAGPAAQVSFVPLTDTLPVFAANAGSSGTPSLSIGALSMQPGGGSSAILLAGTGDPNDALDSYYGDGILRSADGGLTWTLIYGTVPGVAQSFSFRGLGFAGFAWSTVSPGLVVAALSDAAEGEIVGAGDGTSIMGLYYSTDAGATWQMSTLLDGTATLQSPYTAQATASGNAVTAVVWNASRQMFVAAVRFHGYYGSSDGVTWKRLTAQPGAGLTAAACPTIIGGASNCPILRGALAVQSVTGDTFALTVDANDLDQGLWQDVCAINSTGQCGNGSFAFGTRLSSAGLETVSGSTAIPQGSYNLALAAMPAVTSTLTPDTLLLVGTEDLFRCTLAAGCSLRNTTNAANGCAAPARVAPAQHALAGLGSPGPLVFLGNDSGLWRSTDGINQQQAVCSPNDAAHFDNLNSGLGSLAEVSTAGSVTQHPGDAGVLIAGLGANGTAATATAATLTPWPQMTQGEGGVAAIDPANPLHWYVSAAEGISIHACAKGSACAAADFAGNATIDASQVGYDDSAIDAPWLLDPGNSANILAGTCRIWRGPATGGWTAANSLGLPLAGAPNARCGSSNPVIRAIGAGGPVMPGGAAQNSGSTVIYAGLAGTADGGLSAGGHLFVNLHADKASATTVWTEVDTSPVTNSPSGFNPDGYDISSIAVDAHDASGATVYVTVMGFGVPVIYRSIDFGAHWLNITSNLPSAPANAVAIDPNDANTLYIALDTGVYVTSAVTSCSSANCWSIYGTGLPNAPVISLTLSAGLPTGDGRLGEIRAGTYGRGIWQLPLLTAISPLQPAITLTPSMLIFGPQPVGSLSALETITATNTGTAPLTVSRIATTGDFTSADTCTGAAVAVGLGCTVSIGFLPAALGSRTGLVTVYGNIAGGQATATLTGTGAVAASILLTPAALAFPATLVGTTAAGQNITISNTGGISAALQSLGTSGDFNLSANTCSSALPAGVGCTVTVTFSPTTSGSRSGTLSVTDSAGVQTASLTGVGTAPATDALSTLSLTFPSQAIGTASTTQQVLLTNSGDLALTLISTQSTGSFTVVNACGPTLTAHATCALGVSFVPVAVGAATGTLSISDQLRTQTVQLQGTGQGVAGVSLTPAGGLSFPATGVGLVSAPQSVTLTNNGSLALQITRLTASGDFAIASTSTTCGAVLAVNASCAIGITFSPAATGPRAGSVTVTDTAGAGFQQLALSGAGVDFSLSPNGNTSATITAGQSASFPLLLTSAANVIGTAALTCSGAPAHATCTIVPTSVPLGNLAGLTAVTVPVTVTIATSVLGVSLTWPAWMETHAPVLFAGLVPLLPLLLRRRRRRALLIASLLLLSGCGAGRTIPSSGTGTPLSNPTPPGTYTIQISATSTGLIRSVSLTLIVR